MKTPETGVRSQASVVGHQEPEARRGGTDGSLLTPEVDDPRLIPAVQEYLRAMEAGHRPDRQEFLARYPAIAGPLADCLEAMEFVHQFGPRLGSSAVRGTGTPADASPPLDLAV